MMKSLVYILSNMSYQLKSEILTEKLISGTTVECTISDTIFTIICQEKLSEYTENPYLSLAEVNMTV